MTIQSANLGFPRMGSHRQLKRLVEGYWSGKLDQQALLKGAKTLRQEHWEIQQKAGIDFIPSNDFSFYDHVLDMSFMLGVIPARYQGITNPLDQYFAMGRGRQVDGIDVPAQEMKKWFDTNYHFIVPEFTVGQSFQLNTRKAVDEFKEALALGIKTRPVLLGPVSFLGLGKASFNPLNLLQSVLPVYAQLLNELQEAGAEWVQLDEPLLSVHGSELKDHIEAAYNYFGASGIQLKIMLTSYFESIQECAGWIGQLPVDGLHLDLVRAPQDIALVSQLPAHWVVELGLVNGRNIWKTDLSKCIDLVRSVDKRSSLIIAPSCSLLHSPHSLESETDKLQIKNWLAFAKEKLDEVVTIAKAAVDPEQVKDKLASNAMDIESRKHSELIHNPAVLKELDSINPDMFRRKSAFSARNQIQQDKLQLPLFPTTTVGSFPQTNPVRVARQKWKKGDLSDKEYDDFIKDQIKLSVEFQERVGLDMLVHGEFERNDMVEFFGEQLKGFAFTQQGWVQSYGSRCVKPPIIYGDVSRPEPMTVEVSRYAQSLTTKPMKGMLTGPVTVLQWSWVRDDQPRQVAAFQIALALRKEVQDLEAAGLPAIQIDEPAIREGLPLKQKDQEHYLRWAVDAFLLSSTGVEDATQIHTHMCYSDFNDIFNAIEALDADCITIENSKSDLKLLKAFEKHGYQAGIGPGLYDIHSPRVPSVDEMKTRLKAIQKYISSSLLWVNPDCGLKTRGWAETDAALTNMCQVAKECREA